MQEETNQDDYNEDEIPESRIKNFLTENRLKIGFLVFALVIASLVFYYFAIYQAHQPQKIINADLQKKCDILSQKVFSDIQSGISNINYTYKSHYIGSLGRCYIVVHGVGVGQTGLSDKLIDVFTNQTLADCESFSTAPEMDFCSYNEINIKYNIDQFNDFVKPYMETE